MQYEALAEMADKVVKETLQSLPRELAEAVDKVPVFLEPEPAADDVASGIEPDTLGLFDEGEVEVPTPRIRLWLLNIWDYAEGDEEVFCEEVSITLLHEIGHLVGWDEEDVEERGLG
ncbi:hypothetical protein BH09VER1_BH09VER1_04470 [soil metagenome]